MATDKDGNEITGSEDTQSAADSIQESLNSEINTDDPKVKTLSKFKGTTRPQPSVQGIMSAGTYGPQAFSTYFPSEQNNINKGQYSGSIVGSVAQYAPSQLYPFGLIDARKQALAAAADAKVAEQEKWADKMAAIGSPQTKRTGVQPDITKEFYAGLAEIKNKVARENPGVDPNKAAMQSQELKQYTDSWRDVAKHEDELVETSATFQKDAQAGDKTIFGPQKQIMNEINSGDILKRLRSTDPKERAEAQKDFEEIKSLKAMRDPQKVMTEGVKALQPDVQEGFASISPQERYDILTTTKTTKVGDKRIQDYVKNLYNTEYGGNEKQTGFSYDDFAKGFASQFGTKTETQTQTASTKDSGDYNFKMDETALSAAPVSVASLSNKPDEVGSYSLSNAYNIPASNQKPFEMAIPAGAKDVSGNTIFNKTTGNVTSTVSQVGNAIIVHKKGSDADGKAVDQNNPDEIKHYKDNGFTFTVVPQAVMTVEGYDENGKKSPGKNSTIAVDIDHIRNNVMKVNKDGSYKSGVNIPLLQKKAKESEQELNKPVVHKIKGKDYTQAAVEKAAKASNMTVDEYILEANK